MWRLANGCGLSHGGEVIPERAIASISLPLLASARKILESAVVILICWWVLFQLPYVFPSRDRIVSTSYVLGFNNRVAIIGLVALIAIGTGYRLRRHAFVPHIAFEMDNPQRIPLWAISTAALGYALFTAAVYVWADHGEYYSLDWESSHFLWRLKLNDLYGMRPYYDYQFEYGPLLAYSPALLHSLLRPLGASHEASYYLCHLLLNVAGLYGIAFVLNRLQMPARRRNAAFLILGLAGFLPNMGLNGVVVRYIAPFAGLAIVHQTVLSTSQWRVIRVFGATLLVCAACVSLSPEIGLACVLSIAVYCLLSIRTQSVAYVASSAVALTAVLAPMVLPAPYYATLTSFAQGGNNLPFLTTSPHLLLYLACLIWFVPNWLAGIREPNRDQPLVTALAALCVIMAPGALGRCDPYHVLFYGLGISLLVFVQLSNASGVRFQAYAVIYSVVFIVLLQAINFWVHDVTPRTVLNRFTRKGELEEDFEHLAKYESLALTYGTYGYSKSFQQWLWEKRKVAPEFFLGSMGIYTQDQLQQRLRDVARYPLLAIPESYTSRGNIGAAETCLSEWWYLRKAFLHPRRLWFECRQPGLYPDVEIGKYLDQNYRVIDAVGKYKVLQNIQK